MTASEFLKEVDAVIAVSMNNPESIKPCCSKGCSTCCSEALMANRSEVEHMREGYPEDQLEALKSRTQKWLDEFMPFQNAETRDGLIDGYKYLDADIKCPFLVNGLRSVYERRPMGCRVYFAQGDPDNCKMPNRRTQLISDYDFSHPLWTRLWLRFAQSHRGLYMDHLGIHLHNLPFGTELKSSVTSKYEVV